MASLGIKKIWLPTAGTTGTQSDNQVIKNAGYVNIQLHSANYLSKGNAWQNTFGGTDKITLVTNIEYQSQKEKISAASVQDVRTIKVNKGGNLGLQKNLALKVPANCDGIALEVRLIALKNDTLQAKFDMLNTSEYQTALQLAPAVVGQILSITSLVKKLFSDPDAGAQMEVNYAGIVSASKDPNPVNKGMLTSGLVILISTNDGDAFSTIDESKFQLKSDVLHYNGKPVENTYVIFNISFEALRGGDENASWYKKYSTAMDNLDKIMTAEAEEAPKIYQASLDLWIEGNALLIEDPNFIASEKLQLKAAALKQISDRYKELVPPAPPFTPPPNLNFSEPKETYKKATPPSEKATTIEANIQLPGPLDSLNIFKSLTGASSFLTIQTALPKYGSMIGKKVPMIKQNPSNPLNYEIFLDDKFRNEDAVKLISLDANIYMNELKELGLTFNFGKKKPQRGKKGKDKGLAAE